MLVYSKSRLSLLPICILFLCIHFQVLVSSHVTHGNIPALQRYRDIHIDWTECVLCQGRKNDKFTQMSDMRFQCLKETMKVRAKYNNDHEDFETLSNVDLD